MWLPIIALLLGVVTLVWSADRFVNGAAATARNLGMSKLLVGLTIVSLGTSAPEIFVALTAAAQDTSELAVGNAIGSNIANIGLVLGCTALIVPLPFSGAVLRAELPWLIATTLAALVCLYDLHLGPLDGGLLLAMLALMLFRLVRQQRRGEAILPEVEELEQIPELATPRSLLWLLSGLVVLLLSAHLLVWAATALAQALGVSELVIGLTIVAVGTSLPELAATLGSAMKRHADIAIGNVVGSNILNILAVMSLPGLVRPLSLESAVLWRDFGTMLALTVLLVLFTYAINARPIITRFEGAVLLLAWIGYNTLIYYQA